MSKQRNMRIIRNGIKRERRRLAAVDPRVRDGWRARWRDCERHDAAVAGVVPVEFAAWLRRRPTASEAASLSRTLRQMEQAGEVERLPGRQVRLVEVER